MRISELTYLNKQDSALSFNSDSCTQDVHALSWKSEALICWPVKPALCLQWTSCPASRLCADGPSHPWPHLPKQQESTHPAEVQHCQRSCLPRTQQELSKQEELMMNGLVCCMSRTISSGGVTALKQIGDSSEVDQALIGTNWNHYAIRSPARPM